MDKIQKLLAWRGAEFKEGRVGRRLDSKTRLPLERLIAKRYRDFDRIRQCFPRNPETTFPVPHDGIDPPLLEGLVMGGYLEMVGNQYRTTIDPDAVRFMRGGWLEEYAYNAVLHAGAETAVCGQELHWVVDGYHGHTEIDVIARKGQGLLFVSCKTARAELESPEHALGSASRKYLMNHLHEIENNVDHFGKPGDIAALVVTTDLVDEENNNRVRHPTMFGRARRLDVEIVSLEDLRWEAIVKRFQVMLGQLR